MAGRLMWAGEVSNESKEIASRFQCWKTCHWKKVRLDLQYPDHPTSSRASSLTRPCTNLP